MTTQHYQFKQHKMELLNRTRQLLLQQKLRQSPKPSDIQEKVQRGKEFKEFKKSKSWEYMNKWIQEQIDGGNQHFEIETQKMTAWSILKLFNTFAQYLMFLHERRAYKKMLVFIDYSIQEAEDYVRKQSRKTDTKQS